MAEGCHATLTLIEDAAALERWMADRPWERSHPPRSLPAMVMGAFGTQYWIYPEDVQPLMLEHYRQTTEGNAVMLVLGDPQPLKLTPLHEDELL